MKILFLLSHIPNPRINRRIGAVKESFETSLICWNKQTHNLYALDHEDVPAIIIELPASSTEPLKRIKPTIAFGFRALWEIRRRHPDCIYACNLDMLLIAYAHSLFRKTKLIYEVADLNRLVVDSHSNPVKRMLQRIIVRLEKKMCQRVKLLILTSEEHFNQYYKQIIPNSSFLVIPNIPDLSAFENYARKKSKDFTIGFIGAIRYIDQMKMMIDAAEDAGIKVFIAGAAANQEEEVCIQNYCKNKDFVELKGQYNYLREVAGLYGRCDCIFSVYNADMKNVQSAVPNRFYEAVHCELPILVAKGTYLAKMTTALGVGVPVDHKDKRELTGALIKMSTDSEFYSSLVDNCRKYKDEISLDFYNKVLISRIAE